MEDHHIYQSPKDAALHCAYRRWKCRTKHSQFVCNFSKKSSAGKD